MCIYIYTGYTIQDIYRILCKYRRVYIRPVRGSVGFFRRSMIHNRACSSLLVEEVPLFSGRRKPGENKKSWHLVGSDYRRCIYAPRVLLFSFEFELSYT